MKGGYGLLVIVVIIICLHVGDIIYHAVFRKGKINFRPIERTGDIEKALQAHLPVDQTSLEDVLSFIGDQGIELHPESIGSTEFSNTAVGVLVPVARFPWQFRRNLLRTILTWPKEFIFGLPVYGENHIIFHFDENDILRKIEVGRIYTGL